MRVVLGGLEFALEPPGEVSPAEREALSGLAPAARAASPSESPFRLQLAARRGGAAGGPEVAVVPAGRTLRVEHRDFSAVLDPAAATGGLERHPAQGFPLALTLRLAMSSRLPLVGGVPLHAAGIVRDGRADVFFGPSGAGKSTLAGLSAAPLLSDELVAVLPAPGDPARFVCAATGVWGTLGSRAAPRGAFPLRALVQLGRGDRFALQRLEPPAALRALVGVTMIPAADWLWRAGLGALRTLASAIPAYRMEWSPALPPFEALELTLARGREAVHSLLAPPTAGRAIR